MAAPADRRRGDETGLLASPAELGLKVPDCHNKATRGCESCNAYSDKVNAKFKELEGKIAHARTALEQAEKADASKEEIKQKAEVLDEQHRLYRSVGRYIVIIAGQLKG